MQYIDFSPRLMYQGTTMEKLFKCFVKVFEKYWDVIEI